MVINRLNTIFIAHPSAHYLNMRTMEVFSEIDGLAKEIYQETENINLFRFYKYCKRIFDKNGLFLETDHFYPSIIYLNIKIIIYIRC